MSFENDNEKYLDIKKSFNNNPFVLIDSVMYSFAYCKLAGDKDVIFLKFHHLIADGWSLALIIDYILNNYLHLKKGDKLNDIFTPSYNEHIEDEKKYLHSKEFLKNKVYWFQKVRTIPEFIYMKSKSAHYSTESNRTSFLIDQIITGKINLYCKGKNISIFVLFWAIFSIYIKQTTAKEDIIFGTTVLNRLNYKEKNTIGMFIHTIPIRFYVNSLFSFDSYVSQISLEWKNILRNQRYPIDSILNEYHQKNQITSELFDITINYQNALLDSISSFQQVKVIWEPCGHQLNSLNIHINNREQSKQYLIDFDYLVELFTETEIERLYHHLITILNNALNNPHKPIASLELLSPKEKKQLIYEFNRTGKLYYPYNILQSFEKQAWRNPDNIALIFEDQRMSYGELNEKANQTAGMLRSKGVKQNSIVGLLMKRSFEMFIGILGILKAGGAYLPIDPAYPRKLIKEILEDSNCSLLLTTKFIIGNTSWKGQIVNFNTISNFEGGYNPNRRRHPKDLAYVIYTSGSTGNPKGVMIEDRSITNTINWRRKYYQFSSKDVLLQIPPYNFDSSVEDIFTFLSIGAAIVVIDQGKRLDLKYLGRLIRDHRVTHFLATPLLYNAMLDDIPDKLGQLSCITVAGESVHLNLVKKHFARLPQVKLFNEYGPTENSVCSTAYKFCATDGEVLIGKPISNCRCYVFNQDYKPQPVGVPGELYLGGAGLARGYINNPELTAEKFIITPTIKERVYKTGDLVKWTSDGNLQFIERIDNQVKIRGFRIELGEIESSLLKHPSLKEAVVIVDEGDSNRKSLCAYFVSEEQVTLHELKEFLAKRLPEYMIPTYFVKLERLPLTANGKVDRKALPPPERNLKVNWTPPENQVEERMVEVWREVLRLSKIGTNDSIFDLGGDSLAIIRIVTMLYNEHWNLTVKDFYKYNTIKELAGIVISRQQTLKTVIETEENKKGTVLPELKTLKRRPIKHIKFFKPRSVKKVLLTGATGFLGSHVLYELLQLENIETIVIVRGSDKNDAQSRLYQRLNYYFPDLGQSFIERKLAVINGDITKDHFGVLKSQYQQLQQVDTVIHTAALVKHFGEYQEFQRTNVLGVQNILEFSRNKYLMYVSTTSVAGDYANQKDKGRLFFDETCLDIGQSFDDNYYVQTKYEAEKLILGQINDGLNRTVLRVGNLTGRYTDGIFQPNIQENKFYQIIKSIIGLQAIPKSLAKKDIEFTPVDLCSKAIIKLFGMEESGGRTFHLLNHNLIKVKDLVEILAEFGYNTELVKDSLFEEYIRSLIEKKNSFDTLFGIVPDLKNGKLNYNSSIAIDSRFSAEALKQLGFIWPLVDQPYLKKLINHMQSTRFIKKGSKRYNKVL